MQDITTRLIITDLLHFAQSKRQSVASVKVSMTGETRNAGYRQTYWLSWRVFEHQKKYPYNRVVMLIHYKVKCCYNFLEMTMNIKYTSQLWLFLKSPFVLLIAINKTK